MNATLKDCDLPAADSCAIMEGEDVEDDFIFTSKKSLFGKIKSFTSKVERDENSAWGGQGVERGHWDTEWPCSVQDLYSDPHSQNSPASPKSVSFPLQLSTITLFPGA